MGKLVFAPEEPSLDTLQIILTLTVVTFALGILLGFVGAGGAGLIVALLSTGFGLPIHEAIGTGLAAMFFTAIAGAWSHYREGNVAIRAGLFVGIAGVVGAVAGSIFSQGIPETALTVAAGLGLWLLAAMVWFRTRYATRIVPPPGDRAPDLTRDRQMPSVGLGLVGGGLSALLGVGMSPFLQLGLLVVARLQLRQAVGTTMFVLIFVSASAALTFSANGDVSAPHLIGTVVGLSSGSFIGARFTGRAPVIVLRVALVATPVFAGALLLSNVV